MLASVFELLSEPVGSLNSFDDVLGVVPLVWGFEHQLVEQVAMIFGEVLRVCCHDPLSE